MPIPDDQSDASFPPRLQGEISALYGHTPSVPSGVDEAVKANVRAAFGRQRRFRLTLRWGSAAAAVAAVLLLAFHFASTFHSQPRQQAMVYAREDLLHHGRVDILDAFYLARQIHNHAPLQKQWDINGDGVVDQKDVDAIAAVAVRVTPRGGK